jgi:hypothetical protein
MEQTTLLNKLWHKSGITYVCERPARLRRDGRDKDCNFAPTEKLYRRYKCDHFVGNQFSNMGLSLRVPPSLNRSKYSEAQDVLFSEANEFENWGVLSFCIRDIPTPLPEQPPEFDFSPNHDPLEDNFAHTELLCDRRPATGNHVEPRSAIRKLFRATLSQRVTVEIEATV